MSHSKRYTCRNRQLSSITFIGMSGVGKSSLGKALSKRLSMQFLDTDDLIPTPLGQSLQDFLNDKGDAAFKAIEEDTILSLPARDHAVIATGGSVVYSEKAIAHLASFSVIIYLHDSLKHIKSRLSNIADRGIVGLGNKSFDALYYDRLKRYEKAADAKVKIAYPFHLKRSLTFIMNALESFETHGTEHNA